jgi:hypothetical protein
MHLREMRTSGAIERRVERCAPRSALLSGLSERRAVSPRGVPGPAAREGATAAARRLALWLALLGRGWVRSVPADAPTDAEAMPLPARSRSCDPIAGFTLAALKAASPDGPPLRDSRPSRRRGPRGPASRCDPAAVHLRAGHLVTGVVPARHGIVADGASGAASVAARLSAASALKIRPLW